MACFVLIRSSVTRKCVPRSLRLCGSATGGCGAVRGSMAQALQSKADCRRYAYTEATMRPFPLFSETISPAGDVNPAPDEVYQSGYAAGGEGGR